jgi:hypothetical protein
LTRTFQNSMNNLGLARVPPGRSCATMFAVPF